MEFTMSNRFAGLMGGAPGTYMNSNWSDLPVKRADLHCHSCASNEADEAMLEAIGCPESFSEPQEVYDQAKSRGMDFVTITDHDCLGGVQKILDKPDHLVGEELTCYFPEDRCKIHLLVWGLTEQDHADLQLVANDIYRVAAIVEDRNLAHSVAHPVYRQNDVLERWHLERLVLMFKGFETLNGAHSVLHRQSLEPLLDSLTPAMIEEFAVKHEMTARWPLPHFKSRTGGSDDHGLFNIGRTWTEFPGEVQTRGELLDCLRTGCCRPGGEAGSSLKLAHNFFGVGIRYYGKRLTAKGAGNSLHSMMLGTLIGERRSLRRRDWVKAAVISKAKKIGRRLTSPFRPEPRPTGSGLLLDLFLRSCTKRFGEHEALGEAIRTGRAVLGEHTAMFGFLSDVNRDIAAGIADSVATSLDCKELTGVFDAVSAIVAHQFLLGPYYFALFHQNRERQLLARITGHGNKVKRETMKLGVFTDTFDEVNGVGRFIKDMSRQARLNGRTLVVHTSTNNPIADNPGADCPGRKNFRPLLSRPMPYYADQPLTLPPLAEVLEWADRQQFDAIHVHTPGPMGLCGWLVAKMLRVPLLGTYHTDFPGYVHNLTGDYRVTTATVAFMKWFYSQTETTFSRSKEYRGKLQAMGFADEKLTMTLPGVDNEKFCTEKRDETVWKKHGVKENYKLFYAGRVSVEKNLPFLADAFKRLCQDRSDVALVIAGDGPYLPAMKKVLTGLPVYFLGNQSDQTLPALYASSDLFVFPSKTDTLGQVVIEAQASGLAVLVSNVGGPQEVMDDGITGYVLKTENPAVWVDAINDLFNDTQKRQRMGRTASQRMMRFSLAKTFEAFWEEHLNAAVGNTQSAENALPEVPLQRQVLAAEAASPVG
jgi:glycosyltransferase involved in cell wall biosynthesis